MSKLSIKEIFRSDRPERVVLFAKKLEDGSPFEMKDGSKKVFRKADNLELYKALKNNDSVDAKQYIPRDADGVQYVLSKFAKSKEFGGGGSGSGGGSAATDLGESAAAVYCQTLFAGQNTLNDDALKVGFKKAKVVSSINDIIEKLPSQWKESSELTAHAIYSEFKSKGASLTFHHGSKWVLDLENHFKALNRTEKAFSNLNKWTPADIWALTPRGESLPIANTKSIAELNKLLLDALKSHDIIGISLKLVSNKTSAKVKYINTDVKVHTAKYLGFLPGKKSFFDSKDSYFKFKSDSAGEGMIQFRTFPTTWQGEIKGATANHGKVGYGPIADVLKSMHLGNNGWLFGNSNADSTKLRELFKSTDAKTFKDFYAMYKEFAINNPNKLAYEAFVAECKKHDAEWFYSKYLCLTLIKLIQHSRKGDEFINKVIAYASSESDASAPFVKVS